MIRRFEGAQEIEKASIRKKFINKEVGRKLSCWSSFFALILVFRKERYRHEENFLYIALCLVALVVLFSGCGIFNGDDGENTNADPSIPIQWLDVLLDDQYLQRAVMALPVKVDGFSSPLLFQLDTGMDKSHIFCEAYKKWYVSIPEGASTTFNSYQALDVSLSLEFAGQVFENHPMVVIMEEREPPVIIQLFPDLDADGIIGLDLISEYCMKIDFNKSTFSLLSAVPETVKESIAPVPCSIREDSGKTPRIFLPLTVGEEEWDSVIYDSGSSALPLVIGRQDDWIRLTGLQPTDPSVIHLVGGDSQQQKIELIGAVAKESIRVGPIVLPQPMVYTWADARIGSAFASFLGKGLIGNAFFGDQCVAYFDLPRGELFLVPSED